MTGEHPEGDERVCPLWCVIQHHDQELPDDLVHEGAHQEVASVSLIRYHDPAGAPRRQAVAVELSVVRYRYHTDDEDWIYVGDGWSGLDVSPESAQRLARAITGLLDGTQAPPDGA